MSKLGDFHNLPAPGKRAARMGQCFSSTRPTMTLEPDQEDVEPDIKEAVGAPLSHSTPDAGE